MKNLVLAAVGVGSLALGGCMYDPYYGGVQVGVSTGYGYGSGYGYNNYGYGYRPGCIAYDRYGRAYYTCGYGSYGGYTGYGYGGYYRPQSYVYYYPGYTYRQGYYYGRDGRRYDGRYLYSRHYSGKKWRKRDR